MHRGLTAEAYDVLGMVLGYRVELGWGHEQIAHYQCLVCRGLGFEKDYEHGFAKMGCW